jgi:hypothetical protein
MKKESKNEERGTDKMIDWERLRKNERTELNSCKLND